MTLTKGEGVPIRQEMLDRMWSAVVRVRSQTRRPDQPLLYQEHGLMTSGIRTVDEATTKAVTEAREWKRYKDFIADWLSGEMKQGVAASSGVVELGRRHRASMNLRKKAVTYLQGTARGGES